MAEACWLGSEGVSEQQCEGQRRERRLGDKRGPALGLEKPHCATRRCGVWKCGGQARRDRHWASF